MFSRWHLKSRPVKRHKCQVLPGCMIHSCCFMRHLGKTTKKVLRTELDLFQIYRNMRQIWELGVQKRVSN